MKIEEKKKEVIQKHLDEINNKVNEVLGRLVVYHQIPTIKEAQMILMSTGLDMDEIQNELDSD